VCCSNRVCRECVRGCSAWSVFPSNSGPSVQDAARAQALGLGDHLLTDIHDLYSGAVELSESLFQSNTNYSQGTVNCETNALSHVFYRALTEAQDLNDFFNAGNPRFHARTASFCTERSGHFDAFDQGIVFFLPNMTWGMPPFYTHKARELVIWLGRMAPMDCDVLACSRSQLCLSVTR
jgi:hypothetical protein